MFVCCVYLQSHVSDIKSPKLPTLILVLNDTSPNWATGTWTLRPPGTPSSPWYCRLSLFLCFSTHHHSEILHTRHSPNRPFRLPPSPSLSQNPNYPPGSQNGSMSHVMSEAGNEIGITWILQGHRYLKRALQTFPCLLTNLHFPGLGTDSRLSKAAWPEALRSR
jgi:hypothetical protein